MVGDATAITAASTAVDVTALLGGESKDDAVGDEFEAENIPWEPLDELLSGSGGTYGSRC